MARRLPLPILALCGGLAVAVLIPLRTAPLAGQAPPAVLSLSAGAGAETETAGIAVLDLILTIRFAQPVSAADLKGVTVTVSGIDISRLVEPGNWKRLDARTIRISLPLPSLEKAGVPLDDLTKPLRVDADVAVPGQPPLRLASAFDFAADKEVAVPPVRASAGQRTGRDRDAAPGVATRPPVGAAVPPPVTGVSETTAALPPPHLPPASQTWMETLQPAIGPGEFGLGLMGPAHDPVEKRIYRLLGTIKLDYLLQLEKVDEVLPSIAKLVKSTKKKIKYFVVGGHGSPLAEQGGFGIGNILFGMDLVDAPSMERDLKETIARSHADLREVAKAVRAIESQAKTIDASDRIDERKRDPKLDELDSARRRAETTLATDLAKRRRVFNALSNLNDVWGAMADGGVIVLLNCFSGMRAHVPFVEAFGGVLFGEGSGRVVVSEEKIDIGEIPGVDANPKEGQWGTALAAWLYGRWVEGRWKDPGDIVLGFNASHLPVGGRRYTPIPGTLDVQIDQPFRTATPGDRVTLTPTVAPLGNGGPVTFQCGGAATGTGPSCVVETEGKDDQLLEVSIVARDTVGRVGEGLAIVWVAPGRATIHLSSAAPAPGETLTATAQLVRGEMPAEAAWLWRAQGGASLASENYTASVKVNVDGPGTLTAILTGIGPFGKQRTYAQASRPIELGVARTAYKNCFEVNGLPPGVQVCAEYAYLPQKQTAAGTEGCLVDGPALISQKSGPKVAELSFVRGRLDGPYAVYGEGEVPGVTGQFKGDVRDGAWTWWYGNGRKWYEAVLSNGKANGPAAGWYESGRRSKAGTCSNGRRAGSWNDWTDDDDPPTQTVYHADHYVETVTRDGQSSSRTRQGGLGCSEPDDLLGMAVALLNVPEDCARPYFNKPK